MVGVGFTCLSKTERGRLDFGEFHSTSLIQRLASSPDGDEDELLRSHILPESISKQILEHPETFLELAQYDSSTIDRVVENFRLEKLVRQPVCEAT